MSNSHALWDPHFHYCHRNRTQTSANSIVFPFIYDAVFSISVHLIIPNGIFPRDFHMKIVWLIPFFRDISGELLVCKSIGKNSGITEAPRSKARTFLNRSKPGNMGSNSHRGEGIHVFVQTVILLRAEPPSMESYLRTRFLNTENGWPWFAFVCRAMQEIYIVTFYNFLDSLLNRN